MYDLYTSMRQIGAMGGKGRRGFGGVGELPHIPPTVRAALGRLSTLSVSP